MRKYTKRVKIPVTKYNPIFRNELGHYQEDEWTSISDIGKSYNGNEFTFDEYIKIENRYVEAVFLIMDFFKSTEVRITHIFKFQNKNRFNKHNSFNLFETYKKIEIGSIIKNRNEIAELIKLRLREHIAELEITIDNRSRTEILFGFDYYMYLKTNKDVSVLLKQINEIGLFTD